MTVPAPPRDSGDERKHRRQIAAAVNALLQGKLNATGTVTLTANQATTTLTDARLTINSAVLFDPTTANAAADNPYGSTRNNGTWTLTHANNAQTDRTYRYLIIG